MMKRLSLILLSLAMPAYSHAARFVPLGFLAGGDFSQALDVSADGKTVVGESNSSSSGQAFRWTESDGMTSLGDLAGEQNNSTAWGISADGITIVGETGGKSFKWTASDGMVQVGTGRAVATSNDATNIVGFGSGVTLGNAITPDGAVWVGSNDFGSGQEAFRATSGGVQPLGDVPGFDFASVALGVTPDGSVVVGQSNAFLDPDGRGFPVETTVAIRWTQSDGMVPIGDLPGGAPGGSTATDVSADGAVIIGYGESAIGSEAYRWTAASGVVAIRELLLAEGIDTLAMGWNLSQANGISADGRVIVGTGRDASGRAQAWLAELAVPEPSSGVLSLVLAALVFKSRNCR